MVSMMSKVWIVLAVGAVMLTACASRVMSASELTGTWSMTPESKTRSSSKRGVATIVLRQAGTFSVREVPGSLLAVRPDAPLVTGGGRWKLVEKNGEQQIELVFESIVTPHQFTLPFGTQLHISSGRTGVLLYYFEGDPDDGKRIEFQLTQ